jgi:argininosuccinate synthase
VPKEYFKLKPLNMPKLGKRDAHGSTGAGNDQIRFDLIFQTIAPEIESSPIRDLKLSRQEEVDYLAKNGVHYSWEKHNILSTKGYGELVLAEKKP